MLRDRVHRFNASGPEGYWTIRRRAPGRRRLAKAHSPTRDNHLNRDARMGSCRS
ncbi:hypothetical protein [Methylocystis bryophila]|uniref:hypothetical protein n=1 Tax=Methylocystis bryophila TaxID=655015 RepID=UPI003CCA5FF3